MPRPHPAASRLTISEEDPPFSMFVWVSSTHSAAARPRLLRALLHNADCWQPEKPLLVFLTRQRSLVVNPVQLLLAGWTQSRTRRLIFLLDSEEGHREDDEEDINKDILGDEN